MSELIYTQDMRANHESCPLCGIWHTSMSCAPQFAMQSERIAELLDTVSRLTQERDDWHKMADKLAKNHQARNKQGAYCRLCGVLDLGVEKHTPECPVTEYRALIARYSQHEEEK